MRIPDRTRSLHRIGGFCLRISVGGVIREVHVHIMKDLVVALGLILTSPIGYDSGVIIEHPHRRSVYFLDGDENEFEFMQYLTDNLIERNSYAG